MKKIKKDMRLDVYRYWKQLMDHLKWNHSKFFNEKLVYPRQLEIHLPGDHKKPCNLGCPHCAGKFFDKSLGNWEMDALNVLNELKGQVPFHIYGGAYTEPLLNPYFITFLSTTKKFNNHFGIHTNGTLLNMLEEEQGFLTELNRISTDSFDYLSLSLDAGKRESWAKVKKGKPNDFDEIIKGLRKAVEIRNKKAGGHAIRVCYLIYKHNDSTNEIETIVNLAKEIGIDSLRFSIPFGNYNQSFEEIRKYKINNEIPKDKVFEKKLSKYLSKSKDEKPYIFYTGPEFTDIDKFTFKKCVYSYYQLTFGADGFYYRCSTTATPTMKVNRLGKINNNFEHFKKMIISNHNCNWDARKCFANGARCNRMGLEINLEYKEYVNETKDNT